MIKPSEAKNTFLFTMNDPRIMIKNTPIQALLPNVTMMLKNKIANAIKSKYLNLSHFSCNRKKDSAIANTSIWLPAKVR